MRLVCLLALTAIVSGCVAQQRSRAAQRARTELVGMPRRDLLLCAGMPTQQMPETDGIELLSYASGGAAVAHASSYGRRNQHTTGYASSRYCLVTFALVNGIVARVTYSGPTGSNLAPNEQCAYAVRNCL